MEFGILGEGGAMVVGGVAATADAADFEGHGMGL